MYAVYADKTVVVTGASSGIGWEFARQLALHRARVGLIARRRGPLEELAQQIASKGGTAAIAVADVAHRESLEQGLESIRRTLGPIDIMLANAGVGAPTFLKPVNMTDIEAMIRVNVLGVIYSISAVIPEMMKRQSGRIAVVSSLAAYGVLPGESAYCASKAAVNRYLDGLRPQLRPHGIRVTTLCPGFVKTPMTEANQFWMPGLMSAEQAVNRMLRAIARGDKVYNFPWITSMLTGLVGYLPDRVKLWLMNDYNEAGIATGTPKPESSSSEPGGPNPGPT